MFVTAGKRNAAALNMAVYNAFVQSQATSGWQPIRAYADDFRVLASTFDVHARDNTYTTGTGVPIYWVNGGGKVADDYGGLYSDVEDWSNYRPSMRLSNGNSWTYTAAYDDNIFTGSWENGTARIEYPPLSASEEGPLGHDNVATGNPWGQAPFGYSVHASVVTHAYKTNTRRFYGMSPIFRVEGIVQGEGDNSGDNLTDNDNLPALTTDSTFGSESGDGTTTSIDFSVSLSPASASTVTVGVGRVRVRPRPRVAARLHRLAAPELGGVGVGRRGRAARTDHDGGARR